MYHKTSFCNSSKPSFNTTTCQKPFRYPKQKPSSFSGTAHRPSWLPSHSPLICPSSCFVPTARSQTPGSQHPFLLYGSPSTLCRSQESRVFQREATSVLRRQRLKVASGEMTGSLGCPSGSWMPLQRRHASSTSTL